ncbi:MAG: radical SAM protein, partial [Candidatus Fonsibacter sp.]
MKFLVDIHIPYCVKRCGYCDFNTYTPSELKLEQGISNISTDYTEQVLAEISMSKVSVGQARVPTIFFGGGTPSLMNPGDIKRIIQKIRENFDLVKDCEITLETNPDSVTKEKLAQF